MVEEAPVAGPIQVKRYANRRFYDTAHLTYLSLDDFAAMVLAQRRFVVRDATTGDDVTGEILDRLQ